jgi:hypothetical protein
MGRTKPIRPNCCRRRVARGQSATVRGTTEPLVHLSRAQAEAIVTAPSSPPHKRKPVVRVARYT